MASASRADLHADVVVIGGGPGGSTTATMLARKGWRVLLLEREHFPRDHIGESLLPASIPVLEELGVLPAVQEAGFLRKWGATMLWGVEKTPWSWYFRETNQQYPHAYQVWRPLFDKLLLDNSRAHGVDVREGHQVVEVLFHEGRATGVRYTAEGVEGQVQARFVVDASGQGALLGHTLQLRQWDAFFQNLAVYAYFTGAQRLPAPDDTNIFIESYPHGWFWHIPLHTGWTSTGAVVDSRIGQEGIRQAGPQRFLMEQIAQAPRTAAMLRDAQIAYGPFVIRDWSYISTEVVGHGYILVGDAACFVDPLFSSGVHLALMAGVLAAAYVTTVLKDPSMQAAAGQVYKEMYYKEYEHFRAMAQLFYASNRTTESYFWEARRLLGGEAHLSPRHAFIRAVAGQPPRGYERVVLEHGEAPTQFVDSVQALETERAARRAQFLRVARSHPDIMRTALYHAVPQLAPGVTVQRKPVIAAGEFVWGDVLITAGYPEGTPCSALVAELVTLVDGQRSVAELLTQLCTGREAAPQTQIITTALTTLHILYVDSTVAELRGMMSDVPGA
ncbi:MAG: tryptophan 7-halogenase [Candidatus Tectomicrobia bacterium]|uniref:Tryptophan 7-halogenase n=1 Tax=Tectimicrobiota bacterium TaxID=2528274 RepID=A0A937VWJ0_UNCTE|nr:tryptophan 7-halogenase [Candidatus Tectomicrobia bacterium]